MDTIFIRGFSVETVIGVHEWERQVQQELIFNVKIAIDIRQAASTDNVEDTIDYDALTETISRVMSEGQFRLLETAAERVAELLLNTLGISWIRVEIIKPRPLAGGYSVGVSIERGAAKTA